MICHSQIATDRPLIKEVAGYSEKASKYPGSVCTASRTRRTSASTTHRTSAPAWIAKTCHGDLANQTVAERSVDHSMGFLRELSLGEESSQ
jgi:hypothetical protein